MKSKIAGLMAACLLLPACSRNIQTKEAVLQGVLNHLSKRTDLSVSTMQFEVASVNFRGNEAEALVTIKPKGSESAAGMQMRYTLEKSGNQWVVKGKADSGAGAGSHGDQGVRPGSTLPADHPPIGSAGKHPEPQK